MRVRQDFTCFEILNHRLNKRIQKVVELEGKKRQVYVKQYCTMTTNFNRFQIKTISNLKLR